MGDEYYKPMTTGMVAFYLGFSAVTIRAWAKKGMIDYWPTPTGRMMFDFCDVEAFKHQMHVGGSAGKERV